MIAITSSHNLPSSKHSGIANDDHTSSLFSNAVLDSLNVDQHALANRHLWYGLKLLDRALCTIERRLERRRRIVVTVKSTLAG